METPAVLATTLTYGKVRGRVSFQELVDVAPAAGEPVKDVLEAGHAASPLHLHLGEATSSHASHQALHRLHVVGHQHPPAAQRQDGVSRWNVASE